MNQPVAVHMLSICHKPLPTFGTSQLERHIVFRVMKWLRTESHCEKLLALLFVIPATKHKFKFCPAGAGNPRCKVAIVMCRSGSQEVSSRSVMCQQILCADCYWIMHLRHVFNHRFFYYSRILLAIFQPFQLFWVYV